MMVVDATSPPLLDATTTTPLTHIHNVNNHDDHHDEKGRKRRESNDEGGDGRRTLPSPLDLDIHGARRGELSPPLLVLDIHGVSPPPLHHVES